MTDFFEHLNQIPTTLGPIEKEYWEKQHKWAYDQIASKITDDHIIDLGCGCGLLGIYLVYINKVKTATLYDGREPQITYAQDLVTYLGLQDKIKIYKKFVKPGDIIDSTIVTSRFGSLLEFEKFSLTNRLITLRRTKEVEPYFVRPMQLPWTIEIVKRDDGFELELLTIDLYGIGMRMLSSERWMEELNPELMQFSNCIMDRLIIKETQTIGNDSIFVTYNKTA
jgi:hypothetical protein